MKPTVKIKQTKKKANKVIIAYRARLPAVLLRKMHISTGTEPAFTFSVETYFSRAKQYIFAYGGEARYRYFI